MVVNDFSLLPKNEEWGTGDEALDVKLDQALKKAKENLSLELISGFYELGLQLKPRTHNPAFHKVIELVTQALLHFYRPLENTLSLMTKVKGSYHLFRPELFEILELPDLSKMIVELKKNNLFRYQQQIDFSFHTHDLQGYGERNPFVKNRINTGSNSLHTKIIFKDFKNFLNNSNYVVKDKEMEQDPLLIRLKLPTKIIFIENFAELWYHQGQIWTVSHLT